MKVFPKDTFEKLEFDKVKELLIRKCISTLGIEEVSNFKFHSNILILEKQLQQVFEMKTALENNVHFPAQNYYSLEKELKHLGIENFVLEGKQFRKILNFLETIADIFSFFEKNQTEFQTLFEIIKEVDLDKSIASEIEKIVDEEGGIRSNASATLVSIRRQIHSKNNELTKVFNKLIGGLKSQGILADSQESIRNNRRVLAVQATSKRAVKGIILDQSDSGKTTFIEPEQTVFLNNELFELESEERREILKILKDLTAKIAVNKVLLQDYSRMIAKFDFIRAKALLAIDMNATKPILVNEKLIELKDAFHPLLYLHNKNLKKETIPLDIRLSKSQHIVLISGPNAGGKSITLKTVGLLQVMLQFGLLIPCDENSKLTLFKNIFTDLGDNQSIEDELSTYSSRLTNMKYFIENSNHNTLFLVDEFGTGTDPRFGAAMSEAILKKLIPLKAFGIITTHYSNLKKIGEAHPNIISGAMLFDEENFTPKYELLLGKPGSSYTFAIAKKVGFKTEFIDNAKSLVDYSDLKFNDLLEKVEKERKLFEMNNSSINLENKKLKELMSKFDTLNKDLEFQKNLLLKKQLSLEEEKNLQAELQAKKFLNKINKAKSKENAVIQIQNITKDRKEALKKSIKEISLKMEEVQSDNLQKGDSVFMKSNEKEGEVLEVRKNKVIVNINGLSVSVKINDLLKIKKEKEIIRTSAKRIIKIKEVEKTFDIRGLMQTDARAQVEQYFDQALLNNLETIKIIHGKGSGALRNLVKSLVREYKTNIFEWKYEEDKKGGDGATIITFK